MPHDYWLFLAAGLVGGTVNAAAGGAKLFVFPLLLATGLPPIVANASSTVALWPAQLPAAWVYRRELDGDARTFVLRAMPALVGALLGAVALVVLPERVFVAVVPALLIVSVGSIVLGPRAAGLVRRLVPAERLQGLTGWLLFAAGLYGGYFGAGLGFVLLAVLAVARSQGLQRANASKVLLAFCINTVAVVPLALSGVVDWTAATGVLAGGLAGGYLGARVARRLPEGMLRWTVATFGVVLTWSFLSRS